MFQDYYFPESVHYTKKLEFMELIQGSRSMLQYKVKFMELLRFAPHMAGEEMRMAMKFQQGLRSSLRMRVIGFHPRTLADVVETVSMFEREIKELLKLQTRRMPI